MTISLVQARTSPSTALATSVSATISSGIIAVNDLIAVPAFARRDVFEGPSGYSTGVTTVVTPAAPTQRAALFYKDAVAADAVPNSGPVVQATQGASQRLAVAWAIFRSTLGAMTPGSSATTPTVTTNTATGPAVSNATSYVAISIATNVFADGDQADPILAAGTDGAWVRMNTASSANDDNRLGYAYCLVPAGGSTPPIIWGTAGSTGTDQWAVATMSFLEAIPSGVVKGVVFDCLLHDKATPTPDTTGINYSWWDDPTSDVETVTPTATGTFAISSGQATIDLDADTSNAVAANGKLRFEKYDATNPELSLGGTVILPIVDTAA